MMQSDLLREMAAVFEADLRAELPDGGSWTPADLKRVMVETARSLDAGRPDAKIVVEVDPENPNKIVVFYEIEVGGNSQP